MHIYQLRFPHFPFAHFPHFGDTEFRGLLPYISIRFCGKMGKWGKFRPKC